MSLLVSRRVLIGGLIAAPFVVRSTGIMPVKAATLEYLPGDMLSFENGMYRETGFYAVSGHVRRVDGRHIIVADPHSPGGERRLHSRWTKLFHGLPENRVDNPSQRHRLFRPEGRIGLSYPGDAALRAQLNGATP